MLISLRSQKVLVWWTLITTTIFGCALGFLLHMIPPPSPKWSAEQVAEFYTQYASQIKIGATICSWTGAFLVPLAIVVSIQMGRKEGGSKPWAIAGAINGALMTIFLILPPIVFGTAAFTPDRPAEITKTLHELGLLTLVTTDQYYIFWWVGVVVISLLPTKVAHSPFPRWYGYFTAWVAIMFEAGAIAFLTRSGPFAWNGLLVFWSPLSLFGLWIGVTAFLQLKAINAQMEDVKRNGDPTEGRLSPSLV